MSLSKPCPCGRLCTYEDCCGSFIEGRAIPLHPEALMRSRYSAFTLGDMRYIARTMQDKPLKKFNPTVTGRWALSVTWLGLTVYEANIQGNRGIVSFSARFKEGDTLRDITEVSQFYRAEHLWYYTGAASSPSAKA